MLRKDSTIPGSCNLRCSRSGIHYHKVGYVRVQDYLVILTYDPQGQRGAAIKQLHRKFLCLLDVCTFSIFAKGVSFSTVSVDISGPADTDMEIRGESLLCAM